MIHVNCKIKKYEEVKYTICRKSVMYECILKSIRKHKLKARIILVSDECGRWRDFEAGVSLDLTNEN